MKYLPAIPASRINFPPALAEVLLFLCFLQIFCFAVIAHPEIETSEDQKTMIINDAAEEKVVSFGKSVLVKKRVAEVLAVGGDIVIEGHVDGDVATIGGNITQKDGAYVGGDIIIIGGTYKSESETPLREAGKETIVFGILEEQLRNFGQNPTQIFSPSFSLSFLAQRLLVALLWFVISMVVTTIAPGAIGRSVARLKLSPLKAAALGSAAFVLISSTIVGGALALPGFLGATIALMGSIMLLLGYVFGRVTLQVSFGKMVQKHFLSENNRSETLATLIGVLIWTLFLSLPYVWLLALFAVFSVGIGLILTARSSRPWQTT